MRRKCYSYMCPEYPNCANSAGSCCAVEHDGSEDSQDRIILPQECFEYGDLRLFEARPKRFSVDD